MNRVGVISITGLLALHACDQGSPSNDLDIRNISQGLEIGGLMRINDGSPINGADDNGIQYHGGSLLGLTSSTLPTVYYIWYGDWANGDAIPILVDFANNIGGSDYFNINSSYCNATDCSTGGLSVTNQVAYGGSAFDDYSQGTFLDDFGVESIVTRALRRNDLPTDPNGVYFVLSSADVDEVSGLCSRYCGWHSHTLISFQVIKFSYVGSPERCMSGCAAQDSSSPNDDPVADAIANTIAHELMETVTDPDLNAWYDGGHNESADKCAWEFGSEYTAENGSRANVHLGSRDFLMQEIWVNDFGGTCGLNYSSPGGPG